MVLRGNINALYENGKSGVWKELKEYKMAAWKFQAAIFKKESVNYLQNRCLTNERRPKCSDFI